MSPFEKQRNRPYKSLLGVLAYAALDQERELELAGTDALLACGALDADLRLAAGVPQPDRPPVLSARGGEPVATGRVYSAGRRIL
jgi:hypothetical protein